jgi:uncharacterized membrane protein YfcA
MDLAAADAMWLVVGGLAAGVVNTVAGGGSLLTVPLLVLVGVPGGVANGTNRIGVLIQCAAAVWGFRARGAFEARAVVPVLVPVVAGSLIGAAIVSRLPDAAFERVFGVLMLLLLVPTLRRDPQPSAAPAAPWGPTARAAVFFGVGLYAGAFQAGVGVVLLAALLQLGFDAVRANAIKAAANGVAAATAVPVFVWHGQVAWAPALLLAAGFAAGGALGAAVAVRGGARVVRPALAVAVVALAGRMLGII